MGHLAILSNSPTLPSSAAFACWCQPSVLDGARYIDVLYYGDNVKRHSS